MDSSRARRQTCYRADLPERLRACLAERGLSQAKLSQHTSIHQSTLNKILNGKRRPNAAQLGALAYVLDINLEDLLVLPSSANVPVDLEELRAERDQATRRAGEAEAACRREEAARARAEAELKRVERELAAAKLRLDELGKPGRSGRPPFTVELIDVPPPELDEHLAAVQRRGEVIEAIGTIGGKIGSLIYRVHAAQRGRG